MPQEYISLIRDSPCVPRTLQMQLKRINLLQNQAFLTYCQGKIKMIKIIYLRECAKALFHIFITISRLFNFTVSR
jgi:hypothetical protein